MGIPTGPAGGRSVIVGFTETAFAGIITKLPIDNAKMKVRKIAPELRL
jgi:hypothetical protein